MKYVDGYVVPVPKKKLRAYRRMAQKAGKVKCMFWGGFKLLVDA